MLVQISRWLLSIEDWLRPFTRERLIFWGSVVLFAMVSKAPWYHLPEETLNAFGINLKSILLLKGFTLAAVAAGAIALLLDTQRLSRFFVWQALGIILLTPYLLATWVSGLDAVTTNLYAQNQQITRHVEHNLPTVQAQWKRNIPLLPDRTTPLTLGLTIPDSRFFQASSWDYFLLEGLGYRNSVLGFIGKGWILSLVLLVWLLIGLYVRLPNTSEIWWDLRWLVPYWGSLLTLISLSILAVNVLNVQLDTWLVSGNYPKVITTSQRVATWYPNFQCDETFQTRLAHAEFHQGHPHSARIALATGIERYQRGEYGRAIEYLRQALEQDPHACLARIYLAIALLNSAVDYFETPILPNRPSEHRLPSQANFLDSPKARQGHLRAKPAGAIHQLEQVLEVFPGHLEALYNLMLTHSINGNFDQSAVVAQRLVEIQQNFQQPNTALLGQVYTHFAWEEYHNQNLNQAWERYRQSVDPSRWP